MPPIIITGTISVTIIWSLPGATVANTALHANIGGAATVNQAMANTISGHLGAAYVSGGLQAVQPDTVTIERVDIRDLREPNQPLISGTTGLPVSGGIVGGDLLPKQDAIVITKRTLLAGKSYRGRAYLPGFDESVSTAGGEASTGGRDAATGFLDDFNTAMDAEGWPIGVGSLWDQGVRRDPGIITNVTAFVSRVGSFGSQRRRRTAF